MALPHGGVGFFRTVCANEQMTTRFNTAVLIRGIISIPNWGVPMAEPIAVVSIAVILFLGATGINLAIEDWRDRNASKPKNRIVAALRLIFEGVENAVKFIGIAWGLLCFAVFVVLPAYVVIHFIIKFW
jgi:hypothetical protein